MTNLEITDYSTKFRMTTVLKSYFLKLQLLKLTAPTYIKFQVALICKLSKFTLGFSKCKYEIAKTEEFVQAFPANNLRFYCKRANTKRSALRLGP